VSSAAPARRATAATNKAVITVPGDGTFYKAATTTIGAATGTARPGSETASAVVGG
jgi:hypothetical protein